MTSFIHFLATSKRLHPLWRNGYVERAFFLACRALNFRKPQAVFDRSVFGFDFSKWQGVIDFVKVLAYGARFVILRAVYGRTQDERFAEYMPAASALLPTSVYAFYDPVVPPLEQANKVISVLAPYKTKVRRVWLDLEFWWDGAYKDPRHWKTYRDAIKAAGYQVGWYTRKTWWDSRVGSFAAEFAKDPVWAAQYSSALTLIPVGWNIAMLWQSGTPAIGSQVGTQSAEVDFNVWNNDFVFEIEWGGATPPTGGTMQIIKGTVKATVKIRQSPAGLEFNPPRYLVAGDQVEASENSNQWLHLSKINGAPVTETSWASAGSDEQYISWEWVTLPDPEPEPEPTPQWPATMEHTAVLKDDAGAVVATYKGILNKQ